VLYSTIVSYFYVGMISLALLSCTSEINDQKIVNEAVLREFLEANPVFVRPSLDGKLYVIKYREQDYFDLWLFDIEDRKEVFLTRDTVTQLSITWHPSSKFIYYQQLDSFIQCYKLYKIDVRTGTVYQVDLPCSRSAIAPIRFNEDGTFMAYTVDQGKQTILLIVDVENSVVMDKFHLKSPYDYYNFLDNSVIFIDSIPTSIIKLKSVDIDSMTILDLGLDLYVKKVVKFESGFLLVGRMRGEEYYCLYKWNSGILDRIVHDYEINIVDCGVLFDTSYFYISNESGNGRFHSNCRAIEEGIDSTIGFINNFYQSNNGKVFIEGGRFGHRFQILKLDFDHFGISEVEKISDHTKIDTVAAKHKFVKIRNHRTGMDAESYLMETSKPNGKLVLYIHGGPFLQFKPQWSPRTNVLVNNGLSFAAINYHGSDGYSHSFAIENSLETQIEDVIHLIEYVIQNGYEKENIILMGSSYGGLIATKVAVRLNMPTTCLISGIFDRDVEKIPEMEGKVFFFYGEVDPIYQKAEAYLNGLVDANSNIRLMTFSGEGHLFHKSGTWAYVYSQLLNELNE
jgi:dienelactone hydrolase